MVIFADVLPELDPLPSTVLTTSKPSMTAQRKHMSTGSLQRAHTESVLEVDPMCAEHADERLQRGCVPIGKRSKPHCNDDDAYLEARSNPHLCQRRHDGRQASWSSRYR